MEPNNTNSGNSLNRLAGHLAADKKKTVIAVCLIAVMAFMWLRVLSGKSPQAADAALLAQQAAQVQSEPELKVSFIELPNIQGRNDVLTRDFFVLGDKGFDTGAGANVVSGNDSEEKMRQVADKLRLEAIVLGENPQAFINDQLLRSGDKLTVTVGVNTYECQIVEIEEDMVLIKCEEAELELKLTRASQTAN